MAHHINAAAAGVNIPAVFCLTVISGLALPGVPPKERFSLQVVSSSGLSILPADEDIPRLSEQREQLK